MDLQQVVLTAAANANQIYKSALEAQAESEIDRALVAADMGIDE